MDIIASKHIGRFKIGRTLGYGSSCKVKMGYDTSNNNKKVAVKIIRGDLTKIEKDYIDKEINAMLYLKHENIIEIIDYGHEQYVKEGKSKLVQYIVLELASRGQLFDFISLQQPFDEPLARAYFQQFMNGLSFCHQNNIAHRDLKPENLLIETNFNLRIADFGFAVMDNGNNKNLWCNTQLGTDLYMAPEIHLNQQYSGTQVDLFASGVILFIMVAGHPPFSAASPKDSYYKALAIGNKDVFWRVHEKQSDMSYSNEFKDLVEQMLQLDPAKRPTVEQVMAHSWYKGQVPSEENIIKQLKDKSKQIEDAKIIVRQSEQSQQTKDKRTQEYIEIKRSGEYQFSDEDKQKESDKALLKPMKALQQSECFGDYCSLLNVVTSFHPDIIEGDIIKYLQDQKITPTVDSKKYKIKFSFEAPMDNLKNKNYKISVCIRILKVDEDQVCVEFTKIFGPLDKYAEIIRGLKTSNCLANVVA